MASQDTTEFRKIKPDNTTALAECFQKVNFPASKLDVLQQCGNDEIEWTSEEPIMLVDAIREIHQEHFETMDDLIEALMSSIRLAFGDRNTDSAATILQ